MKHLADYVRAQEHAHDCRSGFSQDCSCGLAAALDDLEALGYARLCAEMRFHITHNEQCGLPGGHEGAHVFVAHDCADCGRHHGVCSHCGTTHGDSHERGCKWRPR